MTNAAQAASWAYVTYDSGTRANWYIDKSDVHYKGNLLCFTAQAVHDNVNANGYKAMIALYEVEGGNPARARVVAIAFLDGVGNILNFAEEPDSDQWIDIPPGTIGYEVTNYAVQYAR